MLYIRYMDLLILLNCNFVPFNQHLPISPTSPPLVTTLLLCFRAHDSFRFHIKVRSYSCCFFLCVWLISLISEHKHYVLFKIIVSNHTCPSPVELLSMTSTIVLYGPIQGEFLIINSLQNLVLGHILFLLNEKQCTFISQKSYRHLFSHQICNHY